MAQEMFRICPTTGLRVDLRAQALIKWNAVAGIVFLAIGGLFGLSVALTRWPAVHLLPMDWFYLALTAHGLDVLLLWIIFFEIAVLYFAGAVLLGSRLAAPRAAWTAFVMMLVGGLTTNIAVLQGGSTVMFTSYVPMKAAPHFYLGLILFAVGALIAVFVFFGTLVVAKEERTYKGSIPLVTFGAVTAAVIAVFTLIGAYSLRHSFFDLWISLLFGVVGYLMRKFEFPVAPMVLATVLAKLMETSYMQSLVMSKGSPLIFLTRPISAAFILLTILSVASGIWLRRQAKAKQVELEESDS